MYMSIWWLGVALSDLYIREGRFYLGGVLVPLMSVGIVAGVNGIGVFQSLISGGYRGFGVHPVLEMRHHLFGLLAVMLALGWRSKGWVGFDRIISPFRIFAPISYVIYISHHYLVVEAGYLSFVGNRYLELAGYFVAMLGFAYFLEIILYPYLRSIALRVMVPSTI